MELKEMLGAVGDHLSVRRAFGEGYEKDGVLVIPVAFVAGGGGGGESVEADEDVTDDDHDPLASEHPRRGGAGGGFGGVVVPLGVYVIKEERVRFVPTINPTLIAVAAMGLVKVLARASRRRCRR
jgi:uncharacterized spore protein YtfJ